MHSKIYKGQLRHRRLQPVDHAFGYRMFMMYIDLDEIDQVFKKRWFWSASRPALARFRREDHMGSADEPLDKSVRDHIKSSTGVDHRGPIRLLTHLQYFGYCFNPVSFYFCFNETDTEVETIVAEVNNTPWGEQHCYVLDSRMDQGKGGIKRYHPAKEMHVSPFMQMDVDYDWRFSEPGERLSVHMQNHRKGDKIFDATLHLRKVEISAMSLAKSLSFYPFMTMKVFIGIHWQALLLWLKGSPVHDHPGKTATVAEK